MIIVMLFEIKTFFSKIAKTRFILYKDLIEIQPSIFGPNFVTKAGEVKAEFIVSKYLIAILIVSMIFLIVSVILLIVSKREVLDE